MLGSHSHHLPIVLKNGTLIDPGANFISRQDIRIAADGLIDRIGSNLEAEPGDQIYDIERCMIAPALVDLHTHTRIPSPDTVETAESITASALAGGYTRLTAMPNTQPVMDDPELIRQIRRTYDTLPIRIQPVGCLTIGEQGKKPSPMAELAEAGVCGFSDDGRWISDSGVMDSCLREAARLALPVFSHCEDQSLSPGGMIHPSPAAVQMSLPVQPPESESLAVGRDIMLALKNKARLHLCHLSTQQSCRLVEILADGYPSVTAETAPHYFSLTSDRITSDNGLYKVNPPLRTGHDRDAIIQAIRANRITVIATDHAPHPSQRKTVDFKSSAFGFIGLETALAVGITYLIRPGWVDWLKLIAMMSVNPAAILNHPIAPIQPGHGPDLIVINPDHTWIPTPEHFHSECRNSPFIGQSLIGKVKMTLVRGQLLYQDHTI
ncbi:MAG: dihydroorotase [Candidatus Delongbacteria bacterium]|nr:dihydroorotase [Candidatus Delongbacteria bacterium]